MNNKYGVDEKTFNEWLKHPCTEAYKDFIQYQIESRKEIMSGGACAMDSKGFSDIGQKYLNQLNVISTYESMLNDIEQYQVIIPQDEEDEYGVESTQGVGQEDSD